MNQQQKIPEEKHDDPFSGVWPALITPVSADGNPDFETLEKLVELMVTQEMDGLYILGSTGQGFLFGHEERRRITEVVTEVVDHRLPVMVQVGSLTTRESVELARHAVRCGADGISSVGPIYYGSPDGSSAMALKHYEQIATATDLPFFPYQLGERTFREDTGIFIEKLLKIPNVKGMKLTTNNLLEISSISFSSRGALTLFSGSDELMCHAAMCGTSGAIGSTYNLWGRECRRMRKAFLEGDVQLGTAFMLTFQEVIASILPNFWSFVRQAMLLRYQIDVGMPIPPLGNANISWDDSKVIDLVERVTNAADLKILQEHE